MNWKLFGAMAALIGVGASVALGQGTSTTIVEASYISNVFGQSNFVKNPNAKLNTSNVTVSSATVLRSISSPLVATSEFTITTSTATGFADWSTRTFDQGMKGQNCEARFTYKGFTVGSTTAQIRQGSNTVAQLTLTPSATDPRIASINFPCGDLSAATTFRLQQATAALTGTNEIGGIYVGLATNQANVAQAEMVGGGEWTASSGFRRPANVTQSTYSAFTLGGGNYTTGAVIGKATSAGSDTTITFPYLPAGEYQVVTNFSLLLLDQTQAGECKFSIQEIDSNTYNGQTFSGNIWTSGTLYTPSSMLTGRFNFTTGGQRRFRIVSLNSAAGAVSNCSALTDTTSNKAGIYVYRFPTSSELVVTPERQNTFAGIKGVASGATNLVTTASWTKLTAGSTLTRTNFGKAKVETNNDFSITIDNMPVGNFYISTSGVFAADSSASGVATSCIFGLADSATGGAQIAAMQQIATGDASLAAQTTITSTMGGVYTNSSVANRTFFVQAYRAGGAGQCYGFANTERPVTITVIPLDQPSNSALYVQGPVLGAQTGAAIPAGYVGQYSLNLIGTDKALTSFNGYGSLTTATIPAGVYQLNLSALATWGTVQPQLTRFGMRVTKSTGTGTINNNSTGGSVSFFNCENMWPSTLNVYRIDLTCRPLYVTSDGTLQITFEYIINGTTAGNNQFSYDLLRLN